MGAGRVAAALRNTGTPFYSRYVFFYNHINPSDFFPDIRIATISVTGFKSENVFQHLI